MSRYINWRRVFVSVLIVAFLGFYLGISFGHERSHPSADLEIEVKQFLREYFTVARQYNVVEMMEHVSRSTVESNLRPIIRSPDDDSVKRSARLLFNADFIFAGYCRIHILDVEAQNDGARMRLWLERTVHKPGTGPVYDFSLTREYGKLRLNKTRIVSNEEKLTDQKVDIDLCHIPLNWNNPALLKPEESPEEQQRRLGIP